MIWFFQHVSAQYRYSSICPWPGETTVGSQQSPSRQLFPPNNDSTVLSLFFIFCPIISLQSITVCAEAVPSSTAASLWPLWDSILSSMFVLQSELPLLHTPQQGDLNSVLFLSRDVSTKTVFQVQLPLAHWLQRLTCQTSSSETCFREPTPLGMGYCFWEYFSFLVEWRSPLPHFSALCSWRLWVGACMVITQDSIDWIT